MKVGLRREDAHGRSKGGVSIRRKNFISITCNISSAYILQYMIQLVIEGKNQKTNMSVHDIPKRNKITYNEGHEE